MLALPGRVLRTAACGVELLAVRYKKAFEEWKARRGGTSLGKVFVADVRSLLDELGYEGWVGCEYRPSSGTAEQSFEWARTHGIAPPPPTGN